MVTQRSAVPNVSNYIYIKPTALIPQITVVFPSFTKAEPSAVLIEPEKINTVHKENENSTMGK